jgi:alpha-D-ribose 1-methylphosphonate 5-phosphate C-P lyase
MRIFYNFAFFDEGSKREIRRATLKAVAIPGYQVPFASREMPIARGWGTGGLQLTLSLVGKDDILKVIDQGSDQSVNAVNIKKLITATTGISVTEDTEDATIIQSRHRRKLLCRTARF